MSAPTHADRGRRAWWRTFALALLGMMFLQTAWMLAVPGFEGIDEHDHAYRASAVAHGDLAVTHRPDPAGEGDLLEVQQDIVDAARPVCQSLPYTGPTSCAGPERGDSYEVAGTAARYNPVFYAVVGTIGRPFSGFTSLYVMKAVSALLSGALVAAALATAGRWTSSRWPAAAALLATTPTFIYSSSVLAPNAVEAGGALLLWTALLAAAARSRRGLPCAPLVLPAVVGASALVLVRSVGPLWLVLVVATALLVAPRGSLRRLLGSPSARRGAAVVAAIGVASIAWTLAARTNAVGPTTDPPDTPVLTVLPGQLVLWVLQTMGAFPIRNHVAPLALYAVIGSAWLVVVVLGVRSASRRYRSAMLGVVAASTAIPVVATVLTYDQIGAAWQGRYGLPLSMGLVLLAGWALDARPERGAAARPVLVACAATVAVGTALGTWGARRLEIRISPQLGTTWDPPPVAVLVLLAVLGAGALLLATWHRATAARPAPGSGQGAETQLEPELSRRTPTPTA